MTNADHCEAKLHALRKTQDGVVVSFVLHPNDIPDRLMLSNLGTRYMLAFAEIGDDELPKRKDGDATDDGRTVLPLPTTPETRPRVESAPRGAFNDMPPVKQAGILCADPVFWKFLCENGYYVSNELDTITAVRDICNVESRKHITAGTSAYDKWNWLVQRYRAWQREPEYV